MHPGRIRELIAPFAEIPDEMAAALGSYLELLLRWNARMNLTAVRDPEQIVSRHFGESLFAARHLYAGGEDGRLVDVGSGAGFPGIPIKIWAPAVRVTLIEANQRKATFLREVIRTLRLKEISVFAERAERFEAGEPVTVTLRAVERFEEVLPTAAKIAHGGRLALLIGESQVSVARELAGDLKWAEEVEIPQSKARVLIIGSSGDRVIG